MEKKTVKQEPAEWLPAAAWSQTLEDRTGIDSLREWLKKATRPLYWPPDRRRVRRELQDHIDERVEGLQSRGLSLGDARRETLKRMGDPEEVGALLRQVHKPGLGWALGLARIAAVCLLLAAVVMGILLSCGKLRRPYYVSGSVSVPAKTIEERNQWHKYTLVADRPCRCSDEVQFGAFTVTCEEAVCRYERWETVSKDTALPVELDSNWSWTRRDNRCYIRLRLTAAPWYELPRAIYDLVRVVDDKGFEYRVFSTNYQYYSPHPIARRIDVQTSRIGATEWEIFISFQHRPENAAWLDVVLGQGSSEQKLRVYMGDWQIRDLDSLPLKRAEIIDEFQNLELDYSAYPILPDGLRLYKDHFIKIADTKGTKPIEDGISFSIPRAVCLFTGDRYVDHVEIPLNYRIIDCTLAFRGDTAELPLLSTMLQERLRIVDSTSGEEASEISFEPACTELYHNLCLWRVVWTANGDAKQYELQYRQSPEEEPSVLHLDFELKEEANP